MKETTRHFVLGLSSIFFAPAGALPKPGLRITLPPRTAAESVGQDFARVSGDFLRVLERAEQSEQLELNV